MKKQTIIVSVVVAALVAGALVAFFSMGRTETTASQELGEILVENGFVELRPPSTFFSPGTWVEVRASSPLQLSIICGPQDSLGLVGDEQVASSGSIDLSFQSKLAPRFALDASTLAAWKGNVELSAVKSVTFKLSNVTLKEVADAVVVERFSRRSTSCRDAIDFRLNKPNPVSMVKSALIADVDYVVEFEGTASAEAKAEATKAMAVSLGLNVGADQSNETRLLGKQLVWGVRDDSVLARFGYKLPATGNSVGNRSILGGKGPITEIVRESRNGRAAPDKKTLAAVDLSPLKQSTPMGCWATAYTMMKSWKDGRPQAVRDAVEGLGPTYEHYYAADLGLPGGQELGFVAQAGMVAEPPANYTLSGFVSMLLDYGPLWIIVGDGISSHALVLSGIYGTAADEQLSAYEDAVFEFIDPQDGAFHYVPALDFMADFEREAGAIVSTGRMDLPLRWQVLHWP